MEGSMFGYIVFAWMFIILSNVIMCILRKKLRRTPETQEHRQALNAHLQTLNLQGRERRQAAIAFLNSHSDRQSAQDLNRTMSLFRPSAPYLPAPDNSPSMGRDERASLVKNSLYTTEVNDEKEIANLSLIFKLSTQQENEQYISSRSASCSSWWQSAIESWRSNTFSSTSSVSSSSKPECSICLDAYEIGEKIAWAKTDKCNHIFHEECIQMWLNENDDCPLCRFQILGGDENDV